MPAAAPRAQTARRLVSVVAAALATAVAAVAGPALAASPASAATAVPLTLDGVYETMATGSPAGLDGPVTDLLLVGTTTYRLRLPAGTRPHSGARVRVHARVLAALGTFDARTGRTPLVADQVTQLTAAPRIATTGTTKVLVIRAEWAGQDTLTAAQAAGVMAQDDTWYRQASFGTLGLSATVVPGWVHIARPAGTACQSDNANLMLNAQNGARAQGYDSSSYDRTIVYFPYDSRCAGIGGWAYVPGTQVFLNGEFDSRVTVHEQGHNYGLYHSHSVTCTDGGHPAVMSTTCQPPVDYGDLADAMGSSSYVGEFAAPQKVKLGWLGARAVSLAAGGTVTLAPYESSTTATHAAVIHAGNGHDYWLEYRQPQGDDSQLPAGLQGVLLHLRDAGFTLDDGPSLLDGHPGGGFDDAALPVGQPVALPEGSSITVLTATATGAVVTLDSPLPGAPTGVASTRIPGGAHVTWAAPQFTGTSPLDGFTVTAQPGGATVTTTAAATGADVTGLDNGTSYTFTVAAHNAAGSGPGTTSAALLVGTVPSAPLGVRVVAGYEPGTAEVSWHQPLDDGGAPVTSFTVAAEGLAPVTTDGLTTAATLTGLTAGLSYPVTVQAGTSIGAGPGTAPVSFGLPVAATPPGAPRAVSAQPADGGAVVTWTAPTDDGGSPLTDYVVRATPAGGAPVETSPSPDVRSSQLPLVNGTAYSVVVLAQNSVGIGAASSPAVDVTPGPSPAPATDVAAAPAPHGATVTWVPPLTSPETSVTGYTVTANPGGQTATAGGYDGTATVDGLTDGTAYTFIVTAATSTYDPATGDVVDGVTPASAPSAPVVPSSVPGAPTDVTAGDDVGGVTVSWTGPQYLPATVTGYRVYDAGATTPSAVVTVPPDAPAGTPPATQVTLPAPPGGSVHRYTVTAVNADGEGPPSAPSAEFVHLSVPSAPVVQASPTVRGLAAHWTLADDGGSPPSGFTVSTDPPTVTRFFPGNVTRTTFDDLPRGAYTVTVTADNELGTGAAGHSAPVVPLDAPEPPTGVTAAPTAGGAHVSWTAPPAVPGHPVTAYRLSSTPAGATLAVAGTEAAVGGLQVGTSYRFHVVAVNDLGSSAPSADSNAVTPTPPPPPPPQVRLTAGPPDGGWTGRTATFGFTDGGAATQYSCTLDTTAEQGCSSPWTTPALAAGTHSLQVRAVDGSTVSTVSRSWHVDLTAPTVALGALPPLATGPLLRPTWGAADGGAGLASYDVQLRTAAVSGPFGAWTAPAALQRTTAKGTTLQPAAGATVCLQVRARDTVGNVSGWTPSRCSAVPLDDRALTASVGWTRGTGAGYLANTWTKTTRAGSTLTRPSVQATRFGFLVTKCSTCGTIGLYDGGRLLKTVNLAAPTLQRSVLLSWPPLGYRVGPVVLRSMVAGRVVQVDGLVVSRV